VKLNLYLPDDIGERAKAADPDLNLSRLLRDAVEDELGRRERMAEMVDGASEHELELESPEGTRYTGVLTGKRVWWGETDEEVYVTTDERVMVYNGDTCELHEVEDAEDWSGANGDLYFALAAALGQKARVEV
jgi:hypothetical protein